jgi:2-methylcitrate dehydratase
MAYIISTLLRKSFDRHKQFEQENSPEDIWKYLMLLPNDYSYNAIYNETTRNFMEKIKFTYGGKEYDDQYPKGIPTSISINTKNGN